MDSADDTTDFGYREVPRGEKKRHVGAVFSSVAGRYDLMNDLMSLGIHRLWKCFALELLDVRPGQSVLDLAGGTGDFSLALARRVGPNGRVLLADINAEMLARGRDRLLDAGLGAEVAVVRADAERLPLASGSLDRIVMAFGLRNVTDKSAVLAECRRVLRPGGLLAVLEFSRPTTAALGTLYDAWSFGAIPRIGRWVTGDEASYRYLVESIRRHPDQETLAGLFRAAGLERVDVHNLSGGIVALHRGWSL
ncbi:MAG TPA: bifunctional demethylmenaquinone methyltransferase/2-methoxy-6-polyprenyl-1,4-benzoquinol methylase [Gammaproteobacteria bacterium]|nr:bifunctional demethylmenaquinone methyltransferase/2-methoxy-6-polyprenyl-1,4-benzoquinol methylase [Gammaproteobacteria bacterium]